MKISSSTTRGAQAMPSVRSTRHCGHSPSTVHRLSLVASLVQAQTSTYSSVLTPATPAAVQNTPTDMYMRWVNSPQYDSGATTGTVGTSVLMNIDLTGAGATPAAVTNNSGAAIAAGNQNTTTVEPRWHHESRAQRRHRHPGGAGPGVRLHQRPGGRGGRAHH